MNLWEDARVVRGMRAQLEMRRKRLDSGDAALGWKVGFAAPEMLKRLEITGPLVGFLTRRALVHSGANVSLAGWARPVAEPEIAVHIGRDVSAGADHATAKAAIAGISPAIEIVDVTEPPEDPERILSGNIYQRHVVLAGQAPAKAGSASDGIVCRVLRRGR
jgi:2-keto-4-pentenoate hydratase